MDNADDRIDKEVSETKEDTEEAFELRVEVVEPKEKRVYRRQPEQFRLDAKSYKVIKNALARVCAGRKNVDDPEMAAEKLLKRCLDGKRKDGKDWLNAPKTLEDRLRVFNFDLRTLSEIPNTGSGRRSKLDATLKGGLPREVEALGNVEGSKIVAPVTGKELREFNKRWNAYLKHFPYLNNPADLAVLELLVKHEIMSTRRLNHVLSEQNTRGMSGTIDKDIAENIKKLQETLGIAGNQRMKLMGNIASGTVADLVERFEAYIKDGKYLEIEFLWWKEEAALLLRKADRVFPGGEPEIEDAVFKRLMGVSMIVAREMIKDPYSRTFDEAKKRAWELMKEPPKNNDK